METLTAEEYIFDITPHEVKPQYDDAPEAVLYELSITNKSMN